MSILTAGNSVTGEVSKRTLVLTKSRRGSTGPLGAFTLVFYELCVTMRIAPRSVHVSSNIMTTTNVANYPKAAISKVAREFIEALDEVLLSHGKDHRISDGPVVKAVEVAAVGVS